MKKEYMKPAMRVVQLQQRHIICASNSRSVNAVSTSATDNFGWKNGGFDDSEVDN